MKKSVVSLMLAFALLLPACSNWNRATPKNLDNTAIEEEVRKNLAADKITGLKIDVSNGVVTLEGHLTALDKQKALDDARKVNGVTGVVDKIALQ